ncbi:extradiol ring-cleavage dioxygenase [Pleomassaria siparia CBS 279.74]|uniref:Extradiol ring-cleavage dioxygenase n=1 Tax=Pleomassaria siparia CBS 279.74 TaxID=1314801 RepID=A0A6G1KSH0_9PLEO|nr:extradiol ring-cleavage dioxygenase [Pleomassaria siparia CBS 279.74]
MSNASFNPLRNLQQFVSSPFSSHNNKTTSFPPNMTRLAPVISISHGGGPMPVMGDPSQAAIAHSLRTKVPEILKLGTPEQPRAIVLVTAHWTTDVPTISSAEKHELLYDYYGFPPECYKFKYDAPGSPEVAGLVKTALDGAGFGARQDLFRGWDHGVFIPLMLIHPSASIPIIQLSVLRSASPSTHFAIGQALAPLREQNIAIIGSGFASFHNLRLMFSGISENPSFRARNKAWSKQVADATTTKGVEERKAKFEGWRKWEGSFDMHPKGGEEHFLPLIVCAGAAGEGKAKSWADEMVNMDMWSFWWE